jgi:hypothetical protein
MTTAIKIWFCAAVAMIAAAIADPLVESASNAGWFGPGNFTDHSTWDVVPVLLVGMLFVALHLWSRVRTTLIATGRAPDWPRLAIDALGSNVIRLLPLIYAAQVAILFLMETIEQQVVYGRLLGGMIWLGGPIAISLATHAAITAIVAVTASKLLRTFADAAIQAVHAMRALANSYVRVAHPVFIRFQVFGWLRRFAGILTHNSQRAPPFVTA